MIYPYSFKDKH